MQGSDRTPPVTGGELDALIERLRWRGRTTLDKFSHDAADAITALRARVAELASEIDDTHPMCFTDRIAELERERDEARGRLDTLKLVAIGACSALDRHGEPMVHLLREAINGTLALTDAHHSEGG